MSHAEARDCGQPADWPNQFDRGIQNGAVESMVPDGATKPGATIYYKKQI